MATARPDDHIVSDALSARHVQTFIKNINHIRYEYARSVRALFDHVVVFDEAQRTWTKHRGRSSYARSGAIADFDMSEQEVLLSVMD